MRFRNLLGQIEGMGDLDQVAYFIEGLKPATRMEVSYQAPTDFETAWTLAVRYDVAMYGVGKPMHRYNDNDNLASSRHHRNRRSPSPNNNNQSIPMEIDQVEKRQPLSSENRKKKQLCYNCGKPGHFANVCRSKRNTAINRIEQSRTPSPTAEIGRLEDNYYDLMEK